jgi:ATP-dependent Clp protease ATP-binding subunit ClpA
MPYNVDDLIWLSERSRKVLSLAQEEAQRFNHDYIGTEHILLGLLDETEGVAVRVLDGLGVDLTRVRSAVEFIIGRGEKPAQGEIGLTPRGKEVVALAVDEARGMNHTHIGTEHLLIGLLREGGGVAAGVLESLGVTLEKVRAETHRILTQEAAAAAKPEKRTFCFYADPDERTPLFSTTGLSLTKAILNLPGAVRNEEEDTIILTQYIRPLAPNDLEYEEYFADSLREEEVSFFIYEPTEKKRVVICVERGKEVRLFFKEVLHIP